MNQIYLDTARLLTHVAPLVFVDDTFALKGGTAIDLFVRNLQRLSVDLDLVFADYMLPRDEALGRINEAIRQSAERLKKRGFLTHAPATAAGETKLPVRRGAVQVKVEVNFVMRGTVRPVAREHGNNSVAPLVSPSQTLAAGHVYFAVAMVSGLRLSLDVGGLRCRA